MPSDIWIWIMWSVGLLMLLAYSLPGGTDAQNIRLWHNGLLFIFVAHLAWALADIKQSIDDSATRIVAAIGAENRRQSAD